jgi:hypothetical protein
MEKFKLLLPALFLSLSVFAQNGLHFFSEEVDGDVTGDYVQTTYEGISGDASRTIEAWIKTDGVFDPADGGLQGVLVDWGTVGTGARFTFNVLFNNALRIEIQGSGLSGTIPVNDGIWHHVAVVYDSEDLTNPYKLYVDGVLDVEGIIPTTINTGSDVDLRIGARIDGNRYFSGAIDEVRVWDIPLTPAQLLENKDAEFCASQENLTVYYKLNEGEAEGDNTGLDSTADVAGLGYNGELIGFDLTGTVSNWVEGADLEVGTVTSTYDVISCEAVYTVPSGDESYDVAGEYLDTIPNIMGCDSVMTINLTFAPAVIEESLAPIVCDSYTSPGGVVYEASGLISETFTSLIGCDSITYTIDLTVLERSFDTLHINVCEPFYEVPSGDEVYTETGMYHDTIPNAVGCDSLLTIYLTVEETLFETTVIEACDSYLSESGTEYTSTGSYEETFLSEAGCDSLVLTIDLTIINATFSEIDTIVCGDDYISPSDEVITESGTYTAVIENAVGCDSTINIAVTFASFNLDVSVSDPELMSEDDDAFYQWVDCNAGFTQIDGATAQSFIPTENGAYAVVLTEGFCEEMSDCYTISTVGIAEDKSTTLFNIYPNPINDRFLIELGKVYKNGMITISNITGQIVQMESFTNQSIINVDFAQPAGVYFVHIKADEEAKTVRIVKN